MNHNLLIVSKFYRVPPLHLPSFVDLNKSEIQLAAICFDQDLDLNPYPLKLEKDYQFFPSQTLCLN